MSQGLYKPKSEVPAFLEVVDIAGLVKGASAGAGLGNAFLSNIRAVDGIMHVCRCFEDKVRLRADWKRSHSSVIVARIGLMMYAGDLRVCVY